MPENKKRRGKVIKEMGFILRKIINVDYKTILNK